MIESIFFDLGGVFIDVDPKKSVSRLVKRIGKYTEKHILDLLYNSELNHRFEKGLIDPQTFYHHLLNEWEAEFSFNFFKEIWNHIFSPIQPMIDLLPKLRSTLGPNLY